MNDYHPMIDGPAEPVGLAMDANGNLILCVACGKSLEGRVQCGTQNGIMCYECATPKIQEQKA